MRGALRAILPLAAALRVWRLDQIRFVMLGDLSPWHRRLGAENAGRAVADWVRSNGQPVDPALWRAGGGRSVTMQLYDLRPGGPYLAGTNPAASRYTDIE